METPGNRPMRMPLLGRSTWEYVFWGLFYREDPLLELGGSKL
jgi:hypothetical protein